MATRNQTIERSIGFREERSPKTSSRHEQISGVRKLEQPASKSRIDALDLARGFAICLMILSHSVKGLLTFEQIPAWGMVPIHLVTKFSSTLFILVFGMSLATSFLPYVGTAEWPKRRNKLMIRGLVVLFWYKMLTILEMSHLYERQDIINALLYKTFPVYVEILGYYSIALLWIPWALPYWRNVQWPVKLAMPFILFGLSNFLSSHFNFFGSDIFKAMMVEHPDHYAWGQLARAPMVFAGLIFGEMLLSERKGLLPKHVSLAALSLLSLSFFGAFYYFAQHSMYDHLMQIALNAGKHPPELIFMLFSLGGALMLLSFSIAGGSLLARKLGFFTLIGKNSLNAFVLHIVVLFTFYRYLFDYFHKIEYTYALFLGITLILITGAWFYTVKWVRENG